MQGHPSSRSHAIDVWREAVDRAEVSDSGTATLKSLQAAAAREQMPSACRTPGFLRACLRAKMYNLQKARRLLANYYTLRNASGWETLSVRSTEESLRSGFNLLLPSADEHGCAVVTQSLSKLQAACGPDKSLEGLQKAGFYLLHRALERPEAQRNGIAIVLDFRGFSLMMLRKVKIADFRRGIFMLQDCLPAKLAAIYILHQPKWLNVLIALLTPLVRMPDILTSKFFLCGNDYAALHTHIPAAALPTQLQVGGTLEYDWDAVVDLWLSQEDVGNGNTKFDAASLIALGAAVNDRGEEYTRPASGFRAVSPADR